MQDRKLVTAWEIGDMRYELFSYPVTPGKEMISVFEYLGNRTPPPGTGKQIYAYAKQNNIPLDARTIDTGRWSGSIMVYERQFLDFWFSQDYHPESPGTMDGSEDDGLPF
jgi:hypothetical protein